MPVPDFQSLMLPTLTALSGSSDTSVAEVRQRVAAAEGLTPEEVQELLPSGRQPVFTNRVSWAIIHMERSGLVEKVQRGIYRLAAAGEQLLAQSPTRIDLSFLRHYPAYVAWRKAPSRHRIPHPHGRTMRWRRRRKHWTMPPRNYVNRWRPTSWTECGPRPLRFSNAWWWIS